MVREIHSFAAGIFLLSLFTSCRQTVFEPGKDFAMADSIQAIPTTSVFKDSAWNIWCSSVTKGADNRYHLFYSRWPRKTGHESWVSHSEVAYAVSDTPKGPYKPVNVALPAYSATAWDGAMTHNPYVLYHDGNITYIILPQPDNRFLPIAFCRPTAKNGGHAVTPNA